ncbi:MAG: IS1380 family transposase, partial [Candidatus Schekmanbacteria bacterium]|nr:IS1380 family transposase [Candidatus Schekmanbacteria bacterium]
MLASAVLPYAYEEEGTSSGMTALAGLPPYLDLAHVLGLPDSIRQHVHLRADGQGYSASQMIVSLVLLNLAGGDCVQDLDLLAADGGLQGVLERVELSLAPKEERPGLRRRQRRQRQQWRCGRGQGIVPSPSAAFRFLAGFHNAPEEARRQPGV